MNIFTIENSDFLNMFYSTVQTYTYDLFHGINHSILHDNNGFYKDISLPEETATIIILNKAIFQNLTGFFEMINLKLTFPAFNALRASIESLRLFRACFLDKEFRQKYISNKNIDFRTTPDYSFMQKEVNKILEKNNLEFSANNSQIIIDNNNLIKGSALSELHSELSKWSHLLNINLLVPTHIINNKKIYLGVDDEYDKNMQYVIKKYIEGSYLIVAYHHEFFLGASLPENLLDKAVEVNELYGEYIKKFY